MRRALDKFIAARNKVAAIDVALLQAEAVVQKKPLMSWMMLGKGRRKPMADRRCCQFCGIDSHELWAEAVVLIIGGVPS